MPGPPLIGLTGGIAAGKSTALEILARLGAATISADAIVHDLLGEPALRERLVERWNEDVLADGEVDRARVAAIVFERSDELAWLESVLHPLVGERLLEWRRGVPDDVVMAVVEVPLLFEAGMGSLFDATVAVVAADDTRAERAGKRDTGELEARSGRQLAQEEKAARATVVVQNDGGLAELEAELRRLLPRLREAGR